ncbi:MAG: DnaD domain protein [Lachnospira sp.]
MNLTLSSDINPGYTSVSNIFIEEYLPSANGEFVKVYLYLLHLLENQNRNNTLTVSSIADTFNQTEADIMRALKYWDKLGVLRLSFDGPDKTLSDIKFKEINGLSVNKITGNTTDNSSTKKDLIEPVNVAVTGGFTGEARNATPHLIEPSKIQYTPEKLNELSENEEFRMLIYVIQTYLGKPLSDKETNSVVYFYDTLHFNVELIEYLFEYCLSKGKTSMRYIETVALSWAEQGITCAQDAKNETANYSESVYTVMKAFGLSNRNPAPLEKDYINKWTDTYCFDLDIIIEACNRTMKATHTPSFEYTDRILTNWNNANVRTIQDIHKADADYESSRNSKSRNSATPAKNTNNRFNNFQQRENKTADYYSSLLSNNS